LPAIAAIILNWNDADATINSCQSLLRALDSSADEVKRATIYVVDNGSAAPDASALKQWCINQNNGIVRFISNQDNLGFAGGMNAGILDALVTEPDFLLLLNNDTEVDKSAISALLSFSQGNRQAVIVGATVIDQATGLLQSAGGYCYYPWVAYNRPLLAGASIEDVAKSQNVIPDYVNGAAMWLKGDFVRRIGGLPTDHFLYFEELELNQRLEGEESIAWCKEAVVSHKGGGSLPTAELQAFGTYHAALSAFSYTRHYHPCYLPTVVLARVVGISIRAIVRWQPSLIYAVFRALVDFRRPGKN
jgi:GT2 family glycosyltransferase